MMSSEIPCLVLLCNQGIQRSKCQTTSWLFFFFFVVVVVVVVVNQCFLAAEVTLEVQ